MAVAEYRLFRQAVTIRQGDYQNLTIKTAESLRLTMNEIQRLSYMLMINTDVQAFIMQDKIESGSSDIQTIIDAQRQLSYIKSVHPAIDSLYLYSKKSDYLLEADNAFFNIDAMYTIFFKFRGLNSGQWRAQYLQPVHVNTWMPEISVFSKRIEKNLLVFEQTFPLQNSAANAGKLIILLKTDYFAPLFSSLLSSQKASVWLTDSHYEPLLARACPGEKPETETAHIQIERIPPLSVLHPSMKLLRNEVGHTEPTIVHHRMHGRIFLIITQPIRGTGTTLIVSIPQSTVLWQLLSVRFILSIVVITFLLCYIGYRIFLFFSPKHSLPKANHKPNTTAHSPIGAVNTDNPKAAEEVLHEKDAVLISHIERYIEQSYSNPLLNLSQMANDFGITENFLYYFFRSRMQKSFAQYLEDKRLEKAQVMLEEGSNESLAVLALHCGYANPQTFRRAFKKRYGVTPSDFRHQSFGSDAASCSIVKSMP